jgi:P4 family phage/plasmid primase-like protien
MPPVLPRLARAALHHPGLAQARNVRLPDVRHAWRDLVSLAVPDLEPDADGLTAALAYAKAGWYVLPVKRATKLPGSVVGNSWHTQSSRDPQVIASWFAGTDHGIALHVGRSGALVLDVDTPDNLPAVLIEAFTTDPAPRQVTRDGDDRRAHHIYAQPAGRTLGNGTGQLGGTWGEVRGKNGVIIVAPSVHEHADQGGHYRWLRHGDVPPLPASIADLLHDSVDAGDAASDATIVTFVTSHLEASRPELLDTWLRVFKAKTAAGESRHDKMLSILTGALKESKAGYTSAAVVTSHLREAFITATTSAPIGRQGAARSATAAEDEWRGILAWSVAQAAGADDTGTRERVQEKQPTIGAAPAPPLETHAPPARHLAAVPRPTGTDGPAVPDRAILTVLHGDRSDVATVATRSGPTEDGTALALVELYGDEIRYCPQRGRWLLWDGARWAWDGAEGVREMVRSIARALPEGDGWSSHKRRALSASGVNGITRLAQSDTRVVVDLEDLDSRPLELNTPGGIVDLTTGILRPSDPTSLHTRLTACTPDPDANVTEWTTFLGQTFESAPELVGYMQRLLGYSATGVVRDHVLPFAVGGGGNGKGVTLETATKVLGDYATTAPSAFLMAKAFGAHETEIARLSGARMVLCSEVDSEARFDEPRVKQLTGGDTLTARFMRQDHFTFTPTHKLWLMGNFRPMVKAGGHSFWRRLRLLPFLHTVTDGERVDDLQGYYSTTHGPAVLAWIIAGAVDYLSGGLRDPEVVKVATADYAADQDTVKRFLEECCHIGGGAAVKIKTGLLRTAYERWCFQAGEEPVTAKALSTALGNERGVTLLRSHGARFYEGMTLLADEETGTHNAAPERSGWDD